MIGIEYFSLSASRVSASRVRASVVTMISMPS